MTGITDIPFQIVITDELKGEEYAAYRALTDKATEKDFERVVEGLGDEKNEAIREYYRAFFDIVVEKNPGYIDIIRRKKDMQRKAADIVMEAFKDEIEEKERETKALDIQNLMANLKLTFEQVMEALNIPQSQWDTYAGLVSKAKQ